MPVPASKTKIEQIKKRLGITGVNPFDNKQGSNRNNALNKNTFHQKKGSKYQKPTQQQPATTQKFEGIVDERFDKNVSQVQKNYLQSKQIHKQLDQAKPEGFEKTESKQNVHEIYMEIMQKSKQAKKERQMLKQELDAQIKKLDGTFNKQVQQSVPKGFNQSMNNNTIRQHFQQQLDDKYENAELRHGVLNPNTIEEQVKVGAIKLQQANKAQSAVKKHQNVDILKSTVNTEQLGGDDEVAQFVQDFDLYKDENAEETEEVEEVDEPEENGNINLANELLHGATANNDHFSASLQALPFILNVPDSFEEFSKILNAVEANEEIVVLDRFIKQSSTFVDKSNATTFERFISYCFKHLNQLLQCATPNYERIDSVMRCMRHQTIELPSIVAAQFNGLFLRLVAEFQAYYSNNSMFPAISAQFIVVLRVYALCFLQTSFHKDGEAVENPSLGSYLLLMDLLVYNVAVSSRREQFCYLLLLKMLLGICVQINKYSGGLLYGLQRLLIINNKHISDNEDEGWLTLDFGYIFTKMHDKQVNIDKFIRQEIVKQLQITVNFFKINFEFLPSQLANLLYKNFQFQELNEVQQIAISDQYYIELYANEEDFIVYNHNINFLKKRQFQINEQTPLVQRSFNAKRTNMLDIDKQKQQIQQKYEKRKLKDEFRNQVKQLQKQSMQKQNEQIQQKIQLQKIKNQTLQKNKFDEKYQKKPKKM